MVFTPITLLLTILDKQLPSHMSVFLTTCISRTTVNHEFLQVFLSPASDFIDFSWP